MKQYTLGFNSKHERIIGLSIVNHSDEKCGPHRTSGPHFFQRFLGGDPRWQVTIVQNSLSQLRRQGVARGCCWMGLLDVFKTPVSHAFVRIFMLFVSLKHRNLVEMGCIHLPFWVADFSKQFASSKVHRDEVSKVSWVSMVSTWTRESKNMAFALAWRLVSL